MWVEPTDLPRLSARHDFLLLVGDSPTLLNHLTTLKPRVFTRSADKKTFSVDEMRAIIAENTGRHLSRQYFVIPEADSMSEAAANAALKLLEEPHDNVSFIWLVSDPGRLLPTVRSRASLFYVRLPEATPSPELVADAHNLLSGERLKQLKIIRKYEKDRAACEQLLKTAATLAQSPETAKRVLAVSCALAENVYPRLALLKML